MKILRLVLVIAGIAMIVVALYNAFVPKEVLDIGPLRLSNKDGMSNQTVAMLGLGVVALIAGAFMKRR